MTVDLTLRAHAGYEERVVALAPTVEVRAQTDDDVWLTGVAATVEQPYLVRDWMGDFVETMAAGAFEKTLREADVRLLVDHGRGLLARNRSGTLTLTADPHLRVEAHLDPASPLAAEVVSSLRRGDADAMSIGFEAIRQEWDKDYTTRRVVEARLHEVSLLTTRPPANPATSATLRSVLHGRLDPADPDQVRALIARLGTLLPAEPDPAVTAGLDDLRRAWDLRAATGATV